MPLRAPQMSLASLIEVECRERNLTYKALSDLTGVSAPSLWRYERTGAVPTQENYERLKAYFSDRLGPMQTETDRRRAKARENLVMLNGVSEEEKSERARRGGEAGRGGRKPRRAAALHREYESGARARPSSADAPNVSVPASKARVSLGKYLRGNPFPTSDVLEGWAVDVAARLGLSEDEVMIAWRPKLRTWGLIKDGRPSAESRHVLIERLRTDWVRPDGGAQWGFWRHAARMVRQDEGTEIGGESLRAWWNHHRDHCARNQPGRAKAESAARRRERHEAAIVAVAAGRSRGLAPTMGSGDAAQALGVSRSTIRRLTNDGTLKPLEVSGGGWRRYRTSDVAALARARRK